MGAEVITIFDTHEEIPSETTPDLLAQLLFEYLPKSETWISVPDEDDPAGERWTPQWASISEAILVIDRFLNSPAAHQVEISGFSESELIDEFRRFRDQLEAATVHTDRFHLCVY